jgi:hypothetical protein
MGIKEQEKWLGLDFDGTIADFAKEPGEFGDPLPGVKEEIKALREDGYKIFLDTCRLSTRYHTLPHVLKEIKKLKEWFDQNDIEIDEIDVNQKREAVCRFDDRCIHVDPTSKKPWEDCVKEFVKFETDMLNAWVRHHNVK